MKRFQAFHPSQSATTVDDLGENSLAHFRLQENCFIAVPVILWSSKQRRMPFSLGENGFGTLSSVYTITGTALARSLPDEFP
jgi:hypothetical protein